MTDPVVAERPTMASLSPSRAADFKTCPLLYRLRAIDHIPEAPSSAATRGTVVHAVLQELFALPSLQRTPDAAKAMIEPAWRQLLADEPELASLFPTDSDGSEVAAWLESARQLVDNYFGLEDPSRLDPESCEQLVEVDVGGLLLRGYIDRLDVSPAGEIRIVDYKTGSLPREAFEAKALFQMKFYALVLWRLRGVVARQLKLIYLADRDTLSYTPDEVELERFEGTLRAIRLAIDKAVEAGEFKPSPSKLCGWCDHQSRCPAFGGTPPPFPISAAPAAVEQLHQRLDGSEELSQELKVHVSQ
jgi:putative RecB family exonuclease